MVEKSVVEVVGKRSRLSYSQVRNFAFIRLLMTICRMRARRGQYDQEADYLYNTELYNVEVQYGSTIWKQQY